MKRKISRILGLGEESDIEIKTTVTDQWSGFNFVQIRPGTHYHLYFCFDRNISQLYVFGLHLDEMKAILPDLGSITADNIHPKREYAIRPNPHDGQGCRNGRAWSIGNFCLDPNEFRSMLGIAETV